jgi:arylsulfatase A-like enzyme
MTVSPTDRSKTTSSQPNVIFIICDDLAWGDLACHGNPHTHTPRLDQMHAQSTRLTRYCSGPLCTPARAGILTGRWHLRTRAFDTYCGRAAIDPQEPTIARTLATAGYRTGAFGKWHLGDNYPSRPNDLGFEETLVHRSGGIGQPGDVPANHLREHDSYFDPVLVRNGSLEDSRGYCTDVFTDACLDFISDAQGTDQPFFAYLAFNAPHTPLQIADEWVEPYRQAAVNETHARLYGMVTNIDHNVGRVIDHVDGLGLADKTLIIFTSDHGPCGSSAAGEEGQRFNAGLRGIKGSMYQGGIQTPSFWRWPTTLAADCDIDRVAATVDVLPTLAQFAGAELIKPTDGPATDGQSLVPLLTGETQPDDWVDREVFMHWHRGDAPVRYRNYAVIDQRWKLMRPAEDVADELYDLQADPQERVDLAAQEPDRVTAMRRRYDMWFEDVCTTRGGRTFDPVAIPLGTAHENPVVLSQNDWRTIGDEGWRNDRIRGVWAVRVEEDAQYDVCLMWREDLPAGSAFVALDDTVWSTPVAAGTRLTTLPGISLPLGPARLEAWLHTEAPCETARSGHFIPALYVEVDRAGA